MKLYNTLTRQKEDFKPLVDNLVRIYSCGPTVYNYAHIGNMRAYIFMDSLRRVLKYNDYHLKHVMNITDVGHLVSDADEGEDKMEKTAREQKKDPYEIAAFYMNAFMSDLKKLNVDTPEIIARATEHIPDMIEFVQGLMEKGLGYETSDAIYYDIAKFPNYGRLSRLDLEGQMAGARVEVNEEKHNPADFALWKKAPKEHIMQWPSPWGMGYPGWHIECSTMARKYLGDTFDIHTGGVDHIPVHHENEIAQSDGLVGKQCVQLWAHSEFLLVNNGKMSKSLGNVWTVTDLANKGYDALAYRYFCLNGHYRSKLNFTWETMDASQTAYLRLLEAVLANRGASDPVETGELEVWKSEFEDGINDDLNLPKALGVVWSIARCGKKSQKIYDLMLTMDQVLGLDFAGAQQRLDRQNTVEVPAEIAALVEQRQQARKSRNFAEADRIRDLLKEQGFVLEDTAGGVNIKKL